LHTQSKLFELSSWQHHIESALFNNGRFERPNLRSISEAIIILPKAFPIFSGNGKLRSRSTQTKMGNNGSNPRTASEDRVDIAAEAVVVPLPQSACQMQSSKGQVLHLYSKGPSSGDGVEPVSASA